MTNYSRLSLQILLYVPLLLALSFGHSLLLLWFGGLPNFFHTRALQLAAILVGAVLAGLVVAIVFAYPFAVIYRQHAVAVTSSVAILSAAWRVFLIGKTPEHTFVLVAFGLGVACLAVLPPMGVWVLCKLRSNHSFKADGYAAA